MNSSCNLFECKNRLMCITYFVKQTFLFHGKKNWYMYITSSVIVRLILQISENQIVSV
jgi:hypothetical protein